MNLIKKFAGQAITYGFTHILSRIVYFLIVTLLLTHLLGAEVVEFGIYAYFYAYSTILLALFSFRLDTALFRFGNKNENLEKAFSTALVPVALIALLISILGTVFDEDIASLIRFPDRARYVRWFSYILAFDIINLIPFAKLRLTNKAKTFAFYKVFNVALSSILILFFLLVLPNYQTSLFHFLPQFEKTIDAVFIANLMASGILFLFLLRHSSNPIKPFDYRLLRKMLKYAAPLVIVSVATGVVQYFSTPLQEMFLGGSHEENLKEAGAFEMARRLASLFVMFTTAFNYAAEPFFFNNSSEEDRKSLYGKICLLFVLFGGILVLFLSLFPDLFKWVIDTNYREDLQLMPILLFAYLLLGIYYNVSIWFKLSDQTHYGAYIALIASATTLIISILFLPKIGVLASAMAILTSNFVMVVLAYLWGQKHYPIVYPINKILLTLLIIFLLIVCSYFLRAALPSNLYFIANFILLLGYCYYVWSLEKTEWLRLLKYPT